MEFINPNLSPLQILTIRSSFSKLNDVILCINVQLGQLAIELMIYQAQIMQLVLKQRRLPIRALEHM
ncbi:hypothetical protein D3C71_1708430 [compost metagenome]